MAEIRILVKGLRGWEDPPRVIRILSALPSVDEVTVDAASGQVWIRGRGHLPLLGFLEVLHKAGYDAEPATENTLFPKIFQDEQQILGRLRNALLWTLAFLSIDLLAPRGAWSFAVGMLLVLAFFLRTARPLWMPALLQVKRGQWGEAPRSALALWLLAASMPLAWWEGQHVFVAIPGLVATLLFLSRWMELRWRRILRSKLTEASESSASLQEALGGTVLLPSSLTRLGRGIAVSLPVLALLWLVMMLVLPTPAPASTILRGLAAIFLAAGSRGLILALPSVIAAGLVSATSHGLIFRRARILQNLHRAKYLGLDRVGILTRGQAEVEEVKILGHASAERIYAETAGALAEAEHPLLKALHRFVAERAEGESKPLSVIRSPGGGLEAEIAGRTLLVGHPWYLEREGVNLDEARESLEAFAELGLSIVALSVDGKMRAVFGLRVDPRPEAPSLVRRLGEMGLRPLLLTGEGKHLTQRVAEVHGIAEFHADLDSEGRARVIREKAKEGLPIAAFGIGNHDAPILAAVDFPISLGSKPHTEKPGLILPSGRPGDLLDALAFSRYCDGLTRQNAWLAGTLVLIALVLAFLGILGPLGSAVLHVIAIHAPLANSLRTHSFDFESASS